MTAAGIEFLIAIPNASRRRGDTIAAVPFVNDVESDRFREIDQIGGRQTSSPAQ